ncbi:putative hemolysin [Burkholderiales bacterium JOSHI_001]|nr:putative hemolysin [Burkholderiales bacterium JOSHI_001]
MSHPHFTPAATAPSAWRTPAYRVRLAGSAGDIRASQALRFEVFNLELDEGLASAYDTGLDADPFDEVCEHLLVEDLNGGGVVGTYRMQTGLRASAGLGYYSEREFDFAPFESARAQILELGRACIHRQHRNFAVLNLLWKGIAAHAKSQGARYLVGCSSLTSQDSAAGAAAFQALAPHLAPATWRTRPVPAFACPLLPQARTAPRLPRLLSAYLALGAAICGAPAVDREFRTIDFLTWLDLESPRVLALQSRGRFLA